MRKDSPQPRRQTRRLRHTAARRRQLQNARNRKQFRTSASVNRANQQLRQFRQASILAVAVTSLLLIVFSDGEATQTTPLTQADTTTEVPDTVAIIEEVPTEALETDTAEEDEELLRPRELGEAATDEALGTIRNLWTGFYQNLPKLAVAICALLFAWILVRIVRPLMRKLIGGWQSSGAIIAVTAIGIWLFAIGVALSVLAGDIRALVGSVGLIGLALSWALQTPIESFTGWLMNSFQGYYRVGDRISVGEVFGDVYRIDFLTTTVWEIGSPDRMGFVQAEQPTGRLVTFPNNEVLAGTIINLTRDFPYVWDELAVPVANESDLPFAMQELKRIADRLLGQYMQVPAQQYTAILQKAGLATQIAAEPQLFISTTDSWTNITIRYLVGARERRKWKSELQLHIAIELQKPAYVTRIISAYPRHQVQFIQPDGVPTDIPGYGSNGTGKANP